MNTIELVTGDHNVVDLQLKRNGQPVPIDPAAVVRAAVINDATEQVVGPITCNAAASGADWSNGLVVIEIDAETSEDLPLGSATIEVEVNDNDRRTTFFYRYVTVSEGRIENV